jgi:predicted permease
MSGHRPPALLERLLEWVLPAGLSGQGTLGDLAEEFERRALESPLRARLWYLGQTVSLVAYRILTGGTEGATAGNSDTLMDLRWSFRVILKHPGFALGVVGVLGLGLGANAAVFSVVDGTFRNASWWSEPDRTASIWPGRTFSYGQMTMYQQEQTTYRSVGGYTELAFAVETDDGESESVNGVLISPEIFGELGVQPVLGRGLEPDDAILGIEPVVVIGEALWRRSFGGDPGILGSTIRVSGSPVQVVGIQAAAGNAPGGRAEIWFPLVMDPRDDDYWKASSYTLIGVLNPGATLSDGLAELDAFNVRLSELFPMFYPPGWAEGQGMVTRADDSQRRLIATPLLLLLGGTGLLLLVTALNVGNLLLGRAIERRKEMAVRAAIGASRGRIVRQLFTEAAVFTALAAGLGVWSATLLGPWLAELFVGEAIVTSSSVVSWTVLGFVASVAAAAWLVLGGVPVAYLLREQRFGLRLSPRSSVGAQRSLVAVQAALATLLLVSASLLVTTVGNLRDVPLGFDGGGLVAVELSPPEDRIATLESARNLYGSLVERVEGIPGVSSAGITGWLPMRAEAPPTPINLEADPKDPAQALKAPMQKVDAGFFEAFGVTPLDGRLLRSEDRSDTTSAVVVNQTLAAMLWPDGNAVGQLIATDPHAWSTWAPVVGVIPDIRSGDITGPVGPALYVALDENPARDITLVVRSDLSEAVLVPALRRAVADVDPLVPVRGITSMEAVVRTAYSTSWVVMGLLVALAVLATVLGAVGIYAVLTNHVRSSQREMGVRMALGAEPMELIQSVVRSGMALAAGGILAGSLVSIFAARLLESLLFGVSALSPWAYVAPAVALAVAAAVAALIPALRAGRLAPAEVLRGE